MTSDEGKWQEDPWDGPDAWGSSDFEQDMVEKRPDSRIVLIVLAVVMSVIVSVGASGIWYLRQLNPPDLAGPGAQSTTNFTVNPNDSLVAVSERLQSEGFIVNARVFRWYVARNGGINLQRSRPQPVDQRKDGAGEVVVRFDLLCVETFHRSSHETSGD